MKFSLINVIEQRGQRVSGYWLQNHIGTVEGAYKIANAIEQVNDFKIKVAIVEELPHTNPALHFHRDLIPLA